ncbi:hypothetical protein HanIR_Chr04g0155711 [Helianthus annuus]|nr:hypothetical protein HanIR_Chr04g0155711 [Helianthus annuus]
MLFLVCSNPTGASSFFCIVPIRIDVREGTHPFGKGWWFPSFTLTTLVLVLHNRYVIIYSNYLTKCDVKRLTGFSYSLKIRA